MEKNIIRLTKIFPLRFLLVFMFVLLGVSKSFAYKQTYNVSVGETFTVYATHKTYTQAVLWTYDLKIVEPVSQIYTTSSSVTFRAIAASPSVGSVIQAVTYYHQNGTTSSGVNKTIDNWLVFVEDNSTVSLDKSSLTLTPGESGSITASASNTSYSGRYSWSSSNSNVAYVNGTGKSVYIYANSSGNATISVTLDNGNTAQCYVTVRTIDVNSADIRPTHASIDIDESASLSLSVSPSNATITSRSWYSSNSNVARINSSGIVTGVSEGEAEIYCIVNGSIESSRCYVTVSKPRFTLDTSQPSNNATNQSVFVKPSFTYCRQIYKGGAFENIMLKNETGGNVKGMADISASTLTFVPTIPLDANTKYVLYIPDSAVKDKYGSGNSAITRTFTTGNLQKLTLKASKIERFLPKGERIVLTSNVSDASIYYTLDGSIPTNKSTKYQEAIIVNNDIKLRAIAMQTGYENSNMLSQDYYITNVDVVKRFPDSDTKMYEYKDVNPYVTFSNGIISSMNIVDVKLLKGGQEEVEGDVYVADSSIFFVPKQSLELGCVYQMSIPSDAVKTRQGEANDRISWMFSTGNYALKIASGPELAAAFKTDGTLQTWGGRFKSGNSTDGSYTTTTQLIPSAFITGNIKTISLGYMHHAIITDDGSLWMWGRQYCGEFGNKSTKGAENPIKIMDEVSAVSCGGQSTAIVKSDGSLWMCGRNDYGQIGDNSIISRNEPIWIMDNVSSATAGWCVTYAIKNDGSLWAWGRNDRHQFGGVEPISEQLIPVKIMDDVAIVSTSATEGMWTAAIKTDGTLWVWGEKQPVPTNILDEVSSVAVGIDYVEAVRNDGTLWAFGDNAFGQLGNKTTIDSEMPIKIMDNVAEVTSGGHTTMANMRNGSVWTWGRNYSGILGNGTAPSLTAYTKTPVQVIEGRSSSILQGVSSRKQTYRISKNETNVIDAVPIPMNAVYSEMVWSSKNCDIASVTTRGVIKGEAFGETDIITIVRDDKGNEFSLVSHVIVSEATSIGVINDNNVKVWASNQLLHIAGLEPGQLVSVFSMNTSLIYQEATNSTTMSIPINNKGVYIVRVGDYSIKVLVP